MLVFGRVCTCWNFKQLVYPLKRLPKTHRKKDGLPILPFFRLVNSLRELRAVYSLMWYPVDWYLIKWKLDTICSSPNSSSTWGANAMAEETIPIPINFRVACLVFVALAGLIRYFLSKNRMLSQLLCFEQLWVKIGEKGSRQNFRRKTVVDFFYMSNQQKQGCFGYIGDELLPSYVWILINHYKDPY